MRKWLFGILFLITAISIYSMVTRPIAGFNQQADMPMPTVTIKNQTVKVEVADTEAERIQGLSGHPQLAEDEGMLFIFPQESSGPFWMKDMLFSLDIIWIKENRIVALHQNVPPPSQTNNIPEVVSPNTPYKYVLEVNGGWTSKHEIVVGDSVTITL